MRYIPQEPLLSANQRLDSLCHAVEAHAQASNLIASQADALVAPCIKPPVRDSARRFAQLHHRPGNMTREPKAENPSDQHDG